MKAVVITGVSSGIGYAIAKVLINNGIKVFGSVRNENDAERLSKDFGNLYVPLIFDITDEEKVKKAAAIVCEQLQGQTLWGLINNAGIVVTGALIYLPIKDFRHQLETNLVGHLIVTQAFAPLLGVDQSLKGNPGKIINISSVAGEISYPFFGPYCVSKHALEVFSDILRMELMIFGIDVIVIGPGAIESKIWEKSVKSSIPEKIQTSVYLRPLTIIKDQVINVLKKQALPAEVIGNLVLTILNAKKPKIRYAPVPQKFKNYILPKLLPKRFRQRLAAKYFELLK